jgi:ornithine carbamoyltransferase
MVERLTETMADLAGRSVVSLKEWTPSEIKSVLMTAAWMKSNPKVAPVRYALAGKSVAMIFELPSTRTRVSFQVAIQSLGASPVILDWGESQLGRGEPISDTARVMSRYVDGIVIRCRSHETVQEFKRYASVPVFNALTDQAHPFQALADALTLWERHGRIAGLKFAYFGDGQNNMAYSYLTIGAKLGMHVTIAAPKAYQPEAEIVEWASKEAVITGGSVTITDDPMQAANAADAITTDVFVSMGQDQEAAFKKRDLMAYQVNERLMQAAKRDAIFLHCLPAHRGEEVTEAVLEGPQSAVWDQAENRLFVQKAALLQTLGD